MRVSPSRNNTDTLKFTPASGPSMDEVYTLKPGVIGPRNLMNVSTAVSIVMDHCSPRYRYLLKLPIIKEIKLLIVMSLQFEVLNIQLVFFPTFLVANCIYVYIVCLFV